MSSEREKKIKYLLYLKSKLIHETKKEMKNLREELNNMGNNKVKKR